jgi:hypothetical protein
MHAAQVARCATQGCDDGQLGAREGAWSGEDTTADDEDYATGSVHAGRTQGRRLHETLAWAGAAEEQTMKGKM